MLLLLMSAVANWLLLQESCMLCMLQGAGTDPATVDYLRKCLRSGRDTTVELLNYRKDGRPFWNLLSITHIRDVISGELPDMLTCI